MRILVATTEFPPLRGGISTLVYEQAAGLAALGHTVRVETVEFSGDLPAARENLVINYAPVRSGAVFRLAPLAYNLLKAVRAFRPDFVFCPTYRGFGLPVLICRRLLGVPYAVYIHGTEINTEVRSALRRTIFSRVVRGAESVMTNSTATFELLRNAFPEVHTPSTTINPAVDFQRFRARGLGRQALELRTAWLAKLRKLDNPVVLLSFCRITRQKGLDLVLRALSDLVKANPEYPAVYIAGGVGPDREAFEQLARELGLSDRVLFLGNVPDELVPAVMRAADVYVQPSQPHGGFLEGFGISFLEAQSAGLPCIGSKFGGVVEAVDEGRSAMLVPVGDVKAIAGAMDALVSDQRLRDDMARCAWAHAEKYSWERHSRQLEACIQAAVKGGQPAP